MIQSKISDSVIKLHTKHFATKLNLSEGAFKKHLQRVIETYPELDVLKATDAKKYADRGVSIIMTPSTPSPSKCKLGTEPKVTENVAEETSEYGSEYIDLIEASYETGAEKLNTDKDV